MVRSLTWLGRYFGVTEYLLSLIVVAGATSLPELFVGIDSAFYGAQSLSLGNIIGANILDVTFVIGIAILLAGGKLAYEAKTAKDFYINVSMLILPALLIIDGTLSRGDGFIMLIAFFVYIADEIQSGISSARERGVTRSDSNFSGFIKNTTYFILGALLLIVSADFLVEESVAIAGRFGASLFFMGILISFGTTLPEVIFSVRSVFGGHGGMSLGNVLGSLIFNATFILGLVAVLSPFTVSSPHAIALQIILPLLFVAIINIYGVLKKDFSRFFGLILILSAIAFVLSYL